MPMLVAEQQVRQAPRPRVPTRSGYPSVYRNEEGPIGATRQNFEPWELGRGGALHEYPVTQTNEIRFDYHRRAATARQATRQVHPNDHVGQLRRITDPPNSPGVHRAVTNNNREVIGGTFHPEGNPREFRRARLEHLNREGRRHVRRQQDYANDPRSYPPRGSDNFDANLDGVAESSSSRCR